MNQNLIHLTDWFRGNKLSLLSQRPTICYSLMQPNTCLNINYKYINDQLIEKNFFWVIDDKLKWDVHINK